MMDKALIGQIVAQSAHDYAVPNLIQSDALPEIQDRTDDKVLELASGIECSQ
jgi:hypothetical protein